MLARGDARVRAVLQALTAAHHVTHPHYRVVRDRRPDRAAVVGATAVVVAGAGHVGRWARQRGAATGPRSASVTPVLAVAAPAPARLAVLDEHWHCHPARRAGALQQKGLRDFFLFPSVIEIKRTETLSFNITRLETENNFV